MLLHVDLGIAFGRDLGMKIALRLQVLLKISIEVLVPAKGQQCQRHRILIKRITKEILLTEYIELVNPDALQISGFLYADLRVLAEKVDLPIDLITQSRWQLLLDVMKSTYCLWRIGQSPLAPFVGHYFASIKLGKPCK